jgi:hypothetical protein
MIDYMDEDVAYLLGMLVARGELAHGDGVYRMVIHFPKGYLIAQGEKVQFDTDKEIQIGIAKVRERLVELLGGDIRTVETGESSWDLIIKITRNTIAWRNIAALLDQKSSFPHFQVPEVLLQAETPIEYKREFIRGYADVAGNIRPANRDQAGRHRVRLDTLNYPTNWKVPVQLCLLLQEHLKVPVPHLTWGHPNLGRKWKEHQLNVYAEEFVAAGFCFEYKQAAVEELANINNKRAGTGVSGCPGARRSGPKKPRDPDEANSERLDPALVGKHCDAYWQICRALGCPRRPAPGQQLEMSPESE